MTRFLLTFLAISFIIGCSTENPLCTDNYCITGEIFPKSELEEDQMYGVLPLDEAAILAAIENPPSGDMIAKNVPSFDDWLSGVDRGSEEEKEMFEQATQLRQGLILPPNTFAVSEDFNIFVAHTPKDGECAVLVFDEDIVAVSGENNTLRPRSTSNVGLFLVRHGHNWVVDRYTPE